MKNKDFGQYLDKCRGSTSIQHLADIYGCTKVYMWDILKGNVNPPQNYDKVMKIATELKLNEKQRNDLFDRTALPEDVPIDIKKIILSNPVLIAKIRETNRQGDNKYEIYDRR